MCRQDRRGRCLGPYRGWDGQASVRTSPYSSPLSGEPMLRPPSSYRGSQANGYDEPDDAVGQRKSQGLDGERRTKLSGAGSTSGLVGLTRLTEPSELVLDHRLELTVGLGPDNLGLPDKKGGGGANPTSASLIDVRR